MKTNNRYSIPVERALVLVAKIDKVIESPKHSKVITAIVGKCETYEELTPAKWDKIEKYFLKTFILIECHSTGSFSSRNSYYYQEGTLEELIKAYSYTLECGASYQHEKGNAKINQNPKSVNQLIKNLNNAVNNSAANGYAGKTYSVVTERKN